MEGAGSNLTKFMEDRKKQRRNSIANLKKIIAEVKDEGTESASTSQTTSAEKIVVPAPALKRTGSVEAKLDVRGDGVPEVSEFESSILDTYAHKLPPTPRNKVASEDVSFAKPAKKKVTFSDTSERSSERSTQQQAVEKKAEVTRKFRPRSESGTDLSDHKAILKKYAKKSRDVVELNKKVSDLHQELRREKKKAEQIQENYNTMLAQRSEDEVHQRRNSNDLAQISDLTRKLSLAEQEIVHTKTEYTRLHNEYHKHLAAQSKPREELAEEEKYSKAEFLHAIESSSQELAKLKVDLEKKTSELGNAKEELGILREFRERVFMDQNDKTRLRGLIQKNSSDLMEKDAQISFLDGQLTASRNENRKLREDYEKVVQGEGQKQLLVDELQREKEILLSQVEQYKNNERMNKELKRELQKLAVDLSAKHEQNKLMLQQISEKEQVFHTRQEETGNLERELALVRNALQQSELERDRAVQQKSVHQEELLRLREEASNMEKSKRQLGQLSKVFDKLPTLSTLSKRSKRPVDNYPYNGAARDLNAVFSTQHPIHQMQSPNGFATEPPLSTSQFVNSAPGTGSSWSDVMQLEQQLSAAQSASKASYSYQRY